MKAARVVGEAPVSWLRKRYGSRPSQRDTTRHSISWFLPQSICKQRKSQNVRGMSATHCSAPRGMLMSNGNIGLTVAVPMMNSWSAVLTFDADVRQQNLQDGTM